MIDAGEPDDVILTRLRDIVAQGGHAITMQEWVSYAAHLLAVYGTLSATPFSCALHRGLNRIIFVTEEAAFERQLEYMAFPLGVLGLSETDDIYEAYLRNEKRKKFDPVQY